MKTLKFQVLIVLLTMLFCGTNVFGNIQTTSDGDEYQAILSYKNTVPVQFIKDTTYPGLLSDTIATSGNKSISYSKSSLSFTYSSEYPTQISFYWQNHDRDYHSLLLYVDGVNTAALTSSDLYSKRFFLSSGNHVVEFRDTIWNGVSGWNQTSSVYNLAISEIQPLENYVLSPTSQPLSFKNDDTWPWTYENGYIQNSNYGYSNSTSSFSTSFHIDTPSVFSYDKWVNRYDEYTGNASTYHTLHFYVNNGNYYYLGHYYTDGWTNQAIYLEPGDYSIKFIDQIKNTTTTYYSRIKNIKLSSNWVNVDVASNAGTLGVEVLYLVNVLGDVELLKVSGTINSTDWATIKQMTNLVGLDLTEAKFDAVPEYAFDGLSRLSSVKLPEGVKSIGQYAFRGTQIRSIDIPSSVTSIGQYAFANVWVKTVNFKEDSQLQSIGYSAFSNCTSLKEFIMPNSVTSLGTQNRSSYYENNTTIYYYPSNLFENCRALKKVHFSDNLTTIPANCCYGCNQLTEVELPKKLQKIDYSAFYGTTSLRNIDFPQSLKTIYQKAFYTCGVDSVKLPVTLTTLHSYAFQSCQNLKYIELPSYIGNYNYNFYDCDAVEKIVCQSATPPAISNDPFANGRAKSAITLVVPSFAVVNYKLDSYWYQFGTIVEGDDINYWMITGALSLTNNRRMKGKPEIHLYDNGKLIVGGAAPMEVGQFYYYGYDPEPACLLNDCPSMTADSVVTKYYFSSGKWFFFTPTHDVSKMYYTNNASYVFRYYDGSSRAANGTGNSWKNVVDGKLKAGQGYIFQCNTNCYIYMPAEAKNHSQIFTTNDVTTKLSAYESSVQANKSWNYVGNPYPCYYDIYYMDFTAPITVWTGSTYKAYSIADDDFVLRPMQSFFVQKPDAVDNIIFHKEGRQVNPEVNRASYAKAEISSQNANRNFFNLQITNDEVSDETRIVVNEEAVFAYEIERDASKFMSLDVNVPQLYSIDEEGSSYAINERPLGDGKVKLGYFASQAGFYTISGTRIDGDAILYDKTLNKTINLNEQDYTFYTDATSTANTDRFILMLQVDNTPTALSSADQADKIVVSADNGMISISAANASAQIFTTDGRLVNSLNVKGLSRVSVANGTYIVKANEQTFKVAVY